MKKCCDTPDIYVLSDVDKSLKYVLGGIFDDPACRNCGEYLGPCGFIYPPLTE
jgi:hypothetical protein